MGSFHSHSLAYLAADDRAIAALRRMCPPITHAVGVPSTLRCGDGRAVLCVEAGRLDQWPDALRAEIEGMDLAPFEAFRRANPIPTWDDANLAYLRARVRALTWLSVHAISAKSPLSESRCSASPGKTPCVAMATIRPAPASRYARAALSIELPLRIMSS